MSRVEFEWYGDRIEGLVRRAVVDGLNDTVDHARDDAAVSHTWLNRRYQLEDHIVSEHAKPGDPNPTARFGTTRRYGFYGLFHEEGTITEFARPFLRPAADRWFPLLSYFIKRRWNRL